MSYSREKSQQTKAKWSHMDALRSSQDRSDCQIGAPNFNLIRNLWFVWREFPICMIPLFQPMYTCINWMGLTSRQYRCTLCIPNVALREGIDAKFISFLHCEKVGNEILI